MTIVTETERVDKVARPEILASLRKRDGDRCQHPKCNGSLDFSLTDGPLEVTIDHWMPQHYGKANGWTYEEIWDLSNLKLMHKKCNAKKGDLIPNEDGTLPERAVRKFRYRRDKRATRPELCEVCDNGHNLAPDEVCGNCNATAQRFPRWRKVNANECDHELMWCWACSIGLVERPSSIGTAMRHADSDEIGEFFPSDEEEE